VARFESLGDNLKECNKVIISPVEAAAYEQVTLITKIALELLHQFLKELRSRSALASCTSFFCLSIG
jgi:hypothetical protein